MSNNIIRISESDNFIVDYDKSRGMYRVGVFDNCHFWDEYWFDAYEEKEPSSGDINEVKQMMSQIFCGHKKSYMITNEHMKALEQFVDYTGLDAEKLKECLAKGYLQMVQETIDKAIKEVIAT